MSISPEKIAVVVVTYNGAPWIRGALDSLRSSLAPSTPIIVDNASSDDTVAIVRREYPEAVLVALEKNVGFGRGNNVGIDMALRGGARWVFLLNQDAYVTPNALGALAEFLDRNPEYSIATPLHCSPDTDAVDRQTMRGYLMRYCANYLSDSCIGTVKSHYPIRGINAAAWMARTELFARVGGFDPLFFMYGEDDDLIERFEFHGEKFALVPSSRIVHLRARSPRPRQSLAAALWSQSERVRSQLLLDMKAPRGTHTGKFFRLAANGLMHPTAQLFEDHDLKQWIASFIAICRIVFTYSAIVRSSRLCAQKGAHFLNRST
jgi:GT2 family glycosyltransferase